MCPHLPDHGRSLQGRRQIHLSGKFQQKRADIFPPCCFVKIGGEEETGFVQKHRINAYDEITPMVVMTLQMPTNHVVSYGKKTLVGTTHSEHLILGFSQMPWTHSLPHAGE